MITKKLGKGVTIYQGIGGFGSLGGNQRQTDILYSVIARLEIGKFQTEIQRMDPVAFIVMNSVRDLKGGMIIKRQFKKEN